MNIDQRIFLGSNGRRIRVTLAPREKRSGVGIESGLSTIIFETADSGEWVGSAPIIGGYPLWLLTREEVQEYYARARQTD
jgi:hypothetical protein